MHHAFLAIFQTIYQTYSFYSTARLSLHMRIERGIKITIYENGCKLRISLLFYYYKFQQMKDESTCLTKAQSCAIPLIAPLVIMFSLLKFVNFPFFAVMFIREASVID
jgi:hypothetical protein